MNLITCWQCGILLVLFFQKIFFANAEKRFFQKQFGPRVHFHFPRSEKTWSDSESRTWFTIPWVFVENGPKKLVKKRPSSG